MSLAREFSAVESNTIHQRTNSSENTTNGTQVHSEVTASFPTIWPKHFSLVCEKADIINQTPRFSECSDYFLSFFDVDIYDILSSSFAAIVTSSVIFSI